MGMFKQYLASPTMSNYQYGLDAALLKARQEDKDVSKYSSMANIFSSLISSYDAYTAAVVGSTAYREAKARHDATLATAYNLDSQFPPV